MMIPPYTHSVLLNIVHVKLYGIVLRAHDSILIIDFIKEKKGNSSVPRRPHRVVQLLFILWICF